MRLPSVCAQVISAWMALALFVTAPMSLSAGSASPASLVERVEALMSAMTVEQKVGQLFLVAFSGPRMSRALERMITQYHIGGIVLFDSAGNVQSARQLVALVNEAQAQAKASGARIPLFVAIDEEGGRVARLPRVGTWLPAQMAIGATGSEHHARTAARIKAAELKALGINMNLAPVLDVNDEPHNPVIGTRSFGSSPDLVARLGAAMVAEYRAQRVLAVAKHFPGHGNTDVDSHVALPVVSRTLPTLARVDMFPFVQAQADAIMTAHVVYPALDESAPATLSARVLQGVLREAMGFGGLIVSDSLLMRALTNDADLNAVTVRAFAAGVDVLAIGADVGYTRLDRRTTYQAVLDAVNADPVLQRRLDESVRRILMAKVRYGILDHQPADPQRALEEVGHARHRQAALEIARDSVTLVRDEAGWVPLPAQASVLLVLPAAVNNLGGPLAACHRKLTVARVRQNPTAYDIAALSRRAEKFDGVVLATMNVALAPGQARLAQRLSAGDTPLVVVALHNPYDLMSFPEVKTYLAAYSDVPASLQAVAEVLCGDGVPRGSLPVRLTLP